MMNNAGDLPFHVPEDIAINILRWLPVKSLLRFRCVCKSWRDVIMSDQFIKTHANDVRRLRTTMSGVVFFTNDFNNRPLTIKLYKRGRNFFEVDKEQTINRKLERLMKMKLSETMYIENGYKLVGQCNGIICLRCYDNSIFLLWNPAMRQCRVVPWICSEFPILGMGFGYDSKTEDYKVVSILYHPSGVVKMYSLKNNTWEDIKCPHPLFHKLGFLIVFPECGYFFKGRLYWMAYYRYGNRERTLIVFDLNSNEFMECEIPKSISENRILVASYMFGVINERLSLLLRNASEEYEIWSMKGDSWFKACGFSVEDVCADHELELMGIELTEHGQVLVKLYDPLDDGRFSCLCDIQINNRLKVRKRFKASMYVCPIVSHYLESMVSVMPQTRRSPLSPITGTAQKKMRGY